jgi:hypothetical protein
MRGPPRKRMLYFQKVFGTRSGGPANRRLNFRVLTAGPCGGASQVRKQYWSGNRVFQAVVAPLCRNVLKGLRMLPTILEINFGLRHGSIRKNATV